MGNIINIKNVTKKFLKNNEEVKILNEVNLDIRKGEFITIVGKSGCGKSTIANLIMGFWDIENVYFFINEIENELKKEREFLISFLSKIIVNVKHSVEAEDLKKLINLKNSIRSNVNVKSVIFNFFDILQSS